jgi:septal ring-binding cell division protein DamX
MNNKLILCASILLTACSSGTYVTDVKTESYREDYKAANVKPAMVSETQPLTETAMTVKNVDTPQLIVAKNEFKIIKAPEPKPVKIIPPTAKQVKAAARFGYTVQVVAVGTEDKVIHYAAKLPQQVQPIWQNYKVVKGTKWYTVLFGDYATAPEAQEAIKTLSNELQAMKPFVKSIDSIKNSSYPQLKKLN